MTKHMRPNSKHLKNLFAKQRIVGDDPALKGLVKADTILNNLINGKNVPGLSITVLKEGKTILQKGYGYADLENQTPVDPTKTIFRIASVSKPIAATALAHMVADGAIDLDASFYEYVPYYPKKEWDFTIRQLASHTAGIRSYQGIEYGLNKPYTIKEGIDIFKDDDLIFEPGQGYLYNTFDWVLVSLAMQETSGIPFEDYVQQKVLGPLGMENTFPECHPERQCERPGSNEHRGSEETEQQADLIADDENGHLAKFYSKNRLGFRTAIPVHNFYKLAGGGFLSTSKDIAKFGQSYLEGAVFSEAIRSQFLTSQTLKGNPTYYGLGWQVSEDAAARKFYGHVGNGVGGYSNFFVYPDAGMVFAILVNCTDPKVQVELDGAVDALFGDIQ